MSNVVMRRIRIGTLCRFWCALLLTCVGAQADVVISMQAPRAQSGASLPIDMTITNDSATEVTLQVPAPLRIEAESAKQVATVEFTPSRSGGITIAAQSFVRIRLEGVLPAQLQGEITLTTAGFDSNQLLLHVDPPASPDAVHGATLPPSQVASTGEVRISDKAPPLALSVYEPVYLLFGGDGGLNAKLQFSFRYRLFDDQGTLAERLPWLDDLYLSFSQTSLWDLGDISKPFKDSSYRPRIFFASNESLRLFDGRVRLRLEAGAGHESNGKDGDESRSFNMLYVRPTVLIGDPQGFRWYLTPLIHNYTASSENPDIADYRGYVDWQMGIGSRGGMDFWATLRKGERSNFGSIEFSVSYPLSKLGRDLSGWVMLQYFNGYGESLLDYRQKLDSQIRLGIGLAL